MSDALGSSSKVAVIGAGTMGSGIAQVAARAGNTVYLHDTFPGACERGRKAVEKDLDYLVSKAKLSRQEADAVAARIVPVHKIHAIADAQLVIEAIVEDQEAKSDLLRALEHEVSPQCIIATNTSSLSITALAQRMKHSGRLVGMHFFNPPPRMQLVEVISGLATDPAVAHRVAETAKSWGKTPVHVRSAPGFIVNRVARPFYGEAMRLLTEQAASPATIDAIVRECGGFAMGPYELMDLIGLDVNLAVSRSVFEAMAFDRRYAPSLLQQELVRAGRFGRKTGEGFFRYADGAQNPGPDSEPAAQPADAITFVGDSAALDPLFARLASAGIGVNIGSAAGHIEVGTARVALSDGRTATRRAVEEGARELVLLDLCFDYATAQRIAITRADQCREAVYRAVVGTLQKAGFRVTPIADIAGMVVLRTVAALANEAADVVTQGIATATDIDAAMQLGTNYPQGPLAWADRLGAGFIANVLSNLQQHYGEDRYRVSPLLSRLRYNGGKFHG